MHVMSWLIFPADMVELVDTLGLGPRGNSLAGSSPAIRNQLRFPPVITTVVLRMCHQWYYCVRTKLLLILSHDYVIIN